MSGNSVLRILNVAEKPSIAKSVSSILSGGSYRTDDGTKYNRIFRFPFDFPTLGKADMSFTSVLGHLKDISYEVNPSQPMQYFDAPIVEKVREGMRDLSAMLSREGKVSDAIVLWLDCDREGEAISQEVYESVAKYNRSIRVYRARFSSLVESDIRRSLVSLSSIDKNLVDSVRARRELDLRAGFAFTAFQNHNIRPFYDETADLVLSYGPCQTPTLGFIVNRDLQIQNFKSEEYYSLKLQIPLDLNISFPSSSTTSSGPSATSKGPKEFATYSWKKDRVYNKEVAEDLYRRLSSKGVSARVTRIEQKPTTKGRPVPLNTTEMQILADRHLGLSAKESLEIAEKLYLRGIVSYPRTETTCFHRDTNLGALVDTLAENGSESFSFSSNEPYFGGALSANSELLALRTAAEHVRSTGIQAPPPGNQDDQAHQPIHPLRPLDRGASSEETAMYLLICRYFLASLSSDAVGNSTRQFLTVEAEEFSAGGLVVLDFGWLNHLHGSVKWNGQAPVSGLGAGSPFSRFFSRSRASRGGQRKANAQSSSEKEDEEEVDEDGEQRLPSVLPALREGQILPQQQLRLQIKKNNTLPPSLLTEGELLKKMTDHGIGTDATMAEHIHNVVQRGYAIRSGRHLHSTAVGLALVDVYNGLGLPLARPEVRARVEQRSAHVAAGSLTRAQAVETSIAEFKDHMALVLQKRDELRSALDSRLHRLSQDQVQARSALRNANKKPHSSSRKDSNNQGLKRSSGDGGSGGNPSKKSRTNIASNINSPVDSPTIRTPPPFGIKPPPPIRSNNNNTVSTTAVNGNSKKPPSFGVSLLSPSAATTTSSQSSQSTKQRLCSICRSPDHNKLKCPRNPERK